MKIDKQFIANAIGYTNIREHEGCPWFDIVPEDESLPKGHILFSVYKDEYSLIQAGFGGWHDHFDCSKNEEENIKDALGFMKRLVSGDCYMVMQTDGEGNYIGGTMIDTGNGSTATHMNLGPSSGRRFFKVTFNKPFQEIFVDQT